MPTSAPAARPCPTGAVASPNPEAHAPEGWDPLHDERSLWEEASRFVAETGGGALLALDCARYPCIGELAWPAEDGDHAALRDAMARQWPGSRPRRSQSVIGGVRVEHYGVAFHAEPLSEDMAREVALRRVGFELEAHAALTEFAATLTDAAEEADGAP